jgi:hypothetical protein
MRAAVVVVALAGLAALAGCDPEIISGAYFCGPQMSCPSGEVCSAADGTCGRPELARPFACDPGSETGEPNDVPAAATPISVSACPGMSLEQAGCLPAATDVDWVAVTAISDCVGGPLAVNVRYSAAFAPAVVDLMSPDGATVLGTATPCNITGGIGENDAVCLDAIVPASGTAVIRIGLDPDLDCDGACDFTRYSVTASADSL